MNLTPFGILSEASQDLHLTNLHVHEPRAPPTLSLNRRETEQSHL